MVDHDFDAKLDRYQERLAAEAADAEERSWKVARRPDADPVKVLFEDLVPGDYMTSDGVRWVKVVEVRGPCCVVTNGVQHAADDEVSVCFETPESVIVSGETRFWIERPAVAEITIDRNARRG